MLLRAHLWLALQDGVPSVLLQAPVERLRGVVADLTMLGVRNLDAGLREQLAVPRGWMLCELNVLQGLEALRARRAAHVLLARFMRPGPRRGDGAVAGGGG
jgi:hypothetical protein